MNYRAFLSTIVMLSLLGVVFVLLDQRVNGQDRGTDMVNEEETPFVEIEREETQTEFVIADVDTAYPQEVLARESRRCEFGACLFSGGGGLIGVTMLDGFYTKIMRKDLDGNDTICHALHVRRGPIELSTEEKFSRFFENETHALVIPFMQEQIAHADDWDALTQSTSTDLVTVIAFLPDSIEQGVGPCHSDMHILNVSAL